MKLFLVTSVSVISGLSHSVKYEPRISQGQNRRFDLCNEYLSCQHSPKSPTLIRYVALLYG
jgi:hypothetical protein